MMLPPEVGRVGLRLTLTFFVLAAFVLALTRPAPGSAGFVITMFMFAITGGVGLLVLAVAWLSKRNLIEHLETTERNR